jgi:hypothetical protein
MVLLCVLADKSIIPRRSNDRGIAADGPTEN